MVGPQEISVALVMEDIAEAKSISEALREVGVFPTFFESLDEFWATSLSFTPDLTIFDVKRMSQGTLVLKNHPKVEKGELPMAFYFSHKTLPLLNSTFHFNHYGTIQKEFDLIGQVKSILIRRNHEISLTNKVEQYARTVTRLQSRNSKLSLESNEANRLVLQSEKLNFLKDTFKEKLRKHEFKHAVIETIARLDDCLKFGIYVLGPNRQKLFSPISKNAKYISLPTLWATNEQVSGMEENIIDMAEQVAMDLIDHKVRIINIYQESSHPSALLIARFNEETMQDFPWQELESFLSLVFSQQNLKAIERTKNKSGFIQTSAFLQDLDDIQYFQKNSNFRLVECDLSPLVEKITKFNNRFFWDNFYKDLEQELKENVHPGITFTNHSMVQLLFLIPNEGITQSLTSLKSFLQTFPFYKYFADPNIVIDQFTFSFNFLSPSSVQIINRLNEKFNSINENEAEKLINDSKTRKIGISRNKERPLDH
ncbi:hypothetical protein N9N67_01550 [Bacteriovoracaceae bacterium]|nr:hypothetical protein [Bacteriovoracaceae bacterium]